MIEEKKHLATNKPVLQQILKEHQLDYKRLASLLGISESGLRNLRNGNRGLRLNMYQIKVLSELLSPFNTRLEDLPDDWILEKD